MKIVVSVVNFLTHITKWLGVIVLFFMMLFVFVAVIGRSLNSPLLGDVEIVQFAMIAVIMFSLAYTQMNDKHIKIGLIVDRFPTKIQSIIDILALLITIVITFTLGYVFLKGTIKEFTGTTITSTLLNVPYYPFKFIISLGFFLWTLQAILKIIQKVTDLIKLNNTTNASKGSLNVGVDE